MLRRSCCAVRGPPLLLGVYVCCKAVPAEVKMVSLSVAGPRDPVSALLDGGCEDGFLAC
jgi:hypothetical protein